jgi:hypothetical protein
VSRTTFITNEILWQTLSNQVKNANHVDAAIAYFGQGGAKLLPLRKGHRVIVDMSPPTVRAGGTDPREIEKLIRRGVSAYTRRHLHAKLVIADNCVISGSANVSRHSQQVMDEAAILTTDQSAVRRARDFIDRLCTEPVRDDYLRKCKGIYRPPRFNNQRTNGTNRQQRATHVKLWLVNLREYSVPEAEIERYEQGEAKARKLLKDENRSTADSFHWSQKPKMASELELGDWIVQAMTYHDKTTVVFPPGRLLFIDSYVRGAKGRKERWVFHLEVTKRRETMTWKQFRRATKSLPALSTFSAPRTRPIREVEIADAILGLWTEGGRISRR